MRLVLGKTAGLVSRQGVPPASGIPVSGRLGWGEEDGGPDLGRGG